MPDRILSLEEARKEHLAEQSRKGYRQKTKRQLAEEQATLVQAQQEENRLRAMSKWYLDSQDFLWALYGKMGFIGHRGEPEKLEMILRTLMSFCAKIIATDEPQAKFPAQECAEAAVSEDGSSAPLDLWRDETVRRHLSEFIREIQKERLLISDRAAAQRHTMMAGIAAAMVIQPEIEKTEGTPPLKAMLEEPWYGAVLSMVAAPPEAALDRERREAMVFAHLKSHEVCPGGATAVLLREALTRMADFTDAARIDGWKAVFAELEKRKPGDVPSQPVEAAAPEAGADAGPPNVVPIAPSAEELAAQIDETKTELEQAIAQAEAVAPEAG